MGQGIRALCETDWAVKVVFGGEDVYSSSAKDFPNFLNRERMERPFLWWEMLFHENMSAPWFILPGKCVAFSEHRLVWAHTKKLFASMQSRSETRPSWWFMTPRTCCLNVLAHGVPVCPAGRIVQHTASISRQLMCRPDSSSDQRPKVSLPSHSAPQPLLEAYVMTTFLLCAVYKITPCFSQRRSL